MNKFFIVRHGETKWNIEGRTQGQGDSALSDKGKLQAHKLGNHLKNLHIDFIYSSELGRTIETSEIISGLVGKEVTYDKRLREINFGKWEGLSIDEIKTNYEDIYTVWRNRPHEAIIPDAENLVLLKERMLECILDLNKKHKDANILIISHSMSIKVLLLTLIGSDISNIYKIAQDNTALNVVEFREYGPVIIKLNDSSHLSGKE